MSVAGHCLALTLLATAYWQSRGAQGIDPRNAPMDEPISQTTGRHDGLCDAVRQATVRVGPAHPPLAIIDLIASHL